MREDAFAAVEATYRSDWGRIVATLIRLVGDFDLAEDCAQEAFALALHQWAACDVPANPRAWIVKTARHKAIDRMRRHSHFAERIQPLMEAAAVEATNPDFDDREIPDERLRLIFTCCHPALSEEAQIALTLRTLCGLETEAIARAFLVPEATMAQRLARARRKIRDAGIPYSVPETSEMSERLDAVLSVIYLVFNEGYAATSGERMLRVDLCAEAIRLGRLIHALLSPGAPPDAASLLALMLLHDARRDARVDAVGDIVLLEDQDRSRWNYPQISEALVLVSEASRAGESPYMLQAAIAAEHCMASAAASTKWTRIVELYDALERIQPSAVVSLNRAVAVAMAYGPRAGLAAIEQIAATGELDRFHLLHAARADLLRRLGDHLAAAISYRQAIALVSNGSERRYLERRLRETGVQRS